MNLSASILTDVRRICRGCDRSIQSPPHPIACGAREDKAPILDNPIKVAGFCPLNRHAAVLPELVHGESEESFFDRVRRGVKGIAKAVAHIDAAPADVAASRLAACESCDHLRRGKLGRYCDQCGCYVDLKVRVAAERCPIGTWEAVAAVSRDDNKPCGGCLGSA